MSAIDHDDGPGLDDLELLLRSAVYRAIAKRQEFIVGQKLTELVQDADAVATAKVRGYRISAERKFWMS